MRKYAFTLAEVLITLTIIGVIAALTIPNLMRKWSDHADVQKVKEAYSILSNAYKLCINENGTMENWDFTQLGWVKTGEGEKLFQCMRPYLKVQKYCGNSYGCWNGVSKYEDIYGNKAYSGETNGSNVYGKMKLQNGMYISDGGYGMNVDSSGNATWNNVGTIRVDINGEKGPNRYGYDVFFFAPTRNGIIASQNTAPAPKSKATRASWCSKKSGCTSTMACGTTCAEWIIMHGNMDYKYRDVSAEW